MASDPKKAYSMWMALRFLSALTLSRIFGKLL